MGSKGWNKLLIVPEECSPLQKTDPPLEWKAEETYSEQTDKQSKQVVTVPIFDKINLKLQLLKTDKDGQFLLTKGTINQEYNSKLSSLNTAVPHYMKKIKIKKK